LDFDINNSLNVTGNNKYMFKPVVHFLTPKADDALGIVATGLDNGLAGTPYRDRVSISGGKRPYIYNITSGNIPPGINFDENNGVFSGTPSQAGNYNFTVLVKDATPITQTDIASYVIRIGPSNGLVIETNDLPNGIAGEPYDTNVFALGGNGTYTWLVTDGSLPPGLLLTITTGEIGGTATTAGDYSFRLQVHDGSSTQLTDSQSFNIHIQ
jgi:large repetitive protein